MRKVVCITGASGGIGAAVARAFAPGYNVVAGYCERKQAAEKLTEQLRSDGYEASAYRVDVTDTPSVERFIAFAKDTYGRIDCVVNCAGVSLRALLTDTTDAQWQRLFDVNVTGAFHVCRAAVPHMISRKSGTMIHISSIWGITGAACEVAYSASKAAVIGLTKALAKELAPSGITVNCVAPGWIDTRMNNQLSEADKAAFLDETPLGTAGTPKDVARAALFLAGEPFTTGQVLSPNGGVVI